MNQSTGLWKLVQDSPDHYKSNLTVEDLREVMDLLDSQEQKRAVFLPLSEIKNYVNMFGVKWVKYYIESLPNNTICYVSQEGYDYLEKMENDEK